MTGCGQLCSDMAFDFASSTPGGGPSKAIISARCDFASYWPFLSCTCWNNSWFPRIFHNLPNRIISKKPVVLQIDILKTGTWSYQHTKVPNICLEIPTAAKDYFRSTVIVRLDRINAQLLSCHSISGRRPVQSCREPEIGYFGNHILDFSSVKSPEVIMAAVDSSATLVINLVLHRLWSFNEVGKNVFIFKAHEDIPQL